MGMFQFPLVHPDDPERRMDDSVRIVSDPLVLRQTGICRYNTDGGHSRDHPVLWILRIIRHCWQMWKRLCRSRMMNTICWEFEFESELIRFQQEKFIGFPSCPVLCGPDLLPVVP